MRSFLLIYIILWDEDDVIGRSYRIGNWEGLNLPQVSAVVKE